MRIKSLLFPLALVMLPLLSFAEWKTDSSVKVAILTFNVSADIADPVAITEYIQGLIVDKRVFTIVERSLLEQVLREQQMELSGLTSSDYTRIGQLVGAAKLITGTIAKVGAQYVITIKGIDVATAAIEFSEQSIVLNTDAILLRLPPMVDKFIAKATGREVVTPTTTTTVRNGGTQTTINSTGTMTEAQIYSQVGARLNLARNRLSLASINGLRPLTSELTLAQRQSFYNTYTKKMWLAFGQNNLVPTLGSWSIGDYAGATFSILCILVGGGMSAAFDYNIALIGGGLVLGGYVYNIVSPLIYGSSYNKKLTRAMSLTPQDLSRPNAYSFDTSNFGDAQVFRRFTLHQPVRRQILIVNTN
jgi:hypothetical protein